MVTTYRDIIDFHGHSCPGLAIGYRMANAALTRLSQSKAKDEEVVAIVENDACGVDALQCITGCTFGKGNFVFKDYGKHAYTLYSRKSGKGVRVVFSSDSVPKAIREDRDQYTNWLLSAPEDQIVILREVQIEEPEPARLVDSTKCDVCGESVMLTRTRKLGGKVVCIPCAENSS